MTEKFSNVSFEQTLKGKPKFKPKAKEVKLWVSKNFSKSSFKRKKVPPQ